MRKESWIRSHIYLFVTALLVIQPIMDVASYWLQEWELSTMPVLAFRMALLAATVLLAFCLSDRKWVYWTAAGICAVYFAGHVFACIQAGYQDPFADLTNYVRVIQMPLLTICLITFMRCSKRSFEAMQLGLSLAFLEFLLVEIISTITGTDPHTYPPDMGILGWFFNANSQSSNLSVLLPIILGWQMCWKKRRPVILGLTAIFGFIALYFFCTRLAYLGIMVVSVGMCISICLVRRKDWPIAVGMALIAIVFACLLPVSPMTQHLNLDNSIQDERQGWLTVQLGSSYDEVQDLLSKKNDTDATEESDNGNPAKDEKAGGLTEEERKKLVEELTPIYEFYVSDFVRIFGAEKTIEMYDYTIDMRQFASVRAKKLMFAALLMEDSPFSARLFGLESSRFTVGDGPGYDVENDFHGIYYLYGGVGLGLYLLFIAYFVCLVIWALVKNAKKYFTLEAAGYGIAFLMCMAHAYNTAGVLRRPNASVYLSVVLAGIYYLVRLRAYPEPEKLEASDRKK